MLNSSTRVSLLLVVLCLVSTTIYTVINYPDSTFKDVFLVFKDIALIIVSFFFGTKTNSAQVTATTTPKSQEIFIEK